MKRELTCTGCPMGCALTVTENETGGLIVTGNTCPRGEAYGIKEVTAPERTVTTTVKVIGGTACVVSVKTVSPVPKDKVFECVKALKNVVVSAPVRIGDVVLCDAAGTGIDIAAASNVPVSCL